MDFTIAIQCFLLLLASGKNHAAGKKSGFTLRTSMDDCATGPRKAIIKHISIVPMPIYLLSGNVISSSIPSTQFPWFAAEVDTSHMVDETDNTQFLIPGIIPGAKSMVLELRLEVATVDKNGNRHSYFSESLSGCDTGGKDGWLAMLCRTFYDWRIRYEITTFNILKLCDMKKSLGKYVTYIASILAKNNLKVETRVELLYNKPNGNESIPKHATHNWYPKHYTTYQLFCFNSTSTADSIIADGETAAQHRLDSLKRTVNASFGVPAFPKITNQICYNNGTLLDNGLCQCHGNFSGPGCSFPCPASLYANLSADDCITAGTCVFDIDQYYKHCMSFNNAKLLDKFEIKTSSLHHIDMLITPSQWINPFLLTRITYQIVIMGLGQATLQTSLASGHESKFTLKHLCSMNSTYVCQWNSTRPCNDDPCRSNGYQFTMPYYTNINVSFIMISRVDSIIAPNAHTTVLFGSRTFTTPEGPPGSPTELAVKINSINSANFKWQLSTAACHGKIIRYEIKCISKCHEGPTLVKGDIAQDCREEHDFHAKWPDQLVDGQQFKVRLQTKINWGPYSEVLTYHPASNLIIGLSVPVFASILVSAIIVLLIVISVVLLIVYKKYKRKFQNQCLDGLGNIPSRQQNGSPVCNMTELDAGVGLRDTHRFNLTSGDATKFAPTPMEETISGTGSVALFYHNYYPSYERIAPRQDHPVDESQSYKSESSGYQSNAWDFK